MPNSTAMRPQSSRLLTPDDVAERLQVTPRMIRRMMAEGDIRFVQLRKGRRIRETDLEAYIDASVVEPEGR